MPHYTLDFPNPCTVTSPNGGSQTLNAGTGTVTINLKEGEDVSCTFVNTHTVNSPTISTLLSDLGPINIGDTVHDTSALAGQTADAGGMVKYRVYASLTDCNNGTVATPGGTSAGDKTVTNGIVPQSDGVVSAPPAPLLARVLHWRRQQQRRLERMRR